jgi:hypothetical protein
MQYTGNFNFILLQQHQLNKEVAINWNTAITDAAMWQGITSKKITTPPANNKENDAYIIPVGATDDWATNINDIAVFVNSNWVYFKPKFGTMFFILDEDAIYVFKKASQWVKI